MAAANALNKHNKKENKCTCLNCYLRVKINIPLDLTTRQERYNSNSENTERGATRFDCHNEWPRRMTKRGQTFLGDQIKIIFQIEIFFFNFFLSLTRQHKHHFCCPSSSLCHLNYFVRAASTGANARQRSFFTPLARSAASGQCSIKWPSKLCLFKWKPQLYSICEKAFEHCHLWPQPHRYDNRLVRLNPESPAEPRRSSAQTTTL